MNDSSISVYKIEDSETKWKSSALFDFLGVKSFLINFSFSLKPEEAEEGRQLW